MTSVDGDRARALFEAAVELDESARHEYLAEQCGDDGELLRYVERLLAADCAESDAVLAIDKQVPVTAPPAGPGLAAGQKIGRFEIEGVLGSGGMSTVFAARQENPSRRVALKTMRAGLLSDDARRRFDYEAAILGRLRHPGIAQIYEAGTWQEPPWTFLKRNPSIQTPPCGKWKTVLLLHT